MLTSIEHCYARSDAVGLANLLHIAMMTTQEDTRRSRIDEALEKVITDTEGLFDECFVDRFFDAIVDFRRVRCGRVWVHHEIEYYIDVSDNINIARLLRYHACLSTSDPPLSQEIVKAFMCNFPKIVLRDNPPETVAALTLLYHMVDHLHHHDRPRKELGYIKLIRAARYDQPFAIQNVIDVLKYCMVTTRIYQIQELARKIFHQMVFEVGGITRRASLFLGESIIDTVKEMLFTRNSRLMHIILFELFQDAAKNLESELFLTLIDLVKERFDECLKLPNQPNLDMLAKCMSYVDVPSNVVVNQLISCNHLEAIILYATCSNRSIFSDDKSLMYFVFYPILAKCNTEDAQVLIGRLIVSREEKSFIDRNLKDKHVLQCLGYLQDSMNPRGGFVEFVRPKLRLYILETVLEYFKCHFDSPKALKNLTLCWKIMMDLKDELSPTAKSTWLAQTIDVLHELVERTDYDTFSSKSIFMLTLQLLGRCQYLYSERGKPEKIQRFWIKTNELATKFSHPDVLHEFAQFYYIVESHRVPDDLECDRYADLVWNHITPIGLRHNHTELIGCMASVLLRVDLRMPCSSLRKINIARHREIPQLVGQILIDNMHVQSIFEQIIKSMTEGEIELTDGTRQSYVSYLDSKNLPLHASKALDHLVRGICLSMRHLHGEISHRHVGLPALTMLYYLIPTILINSDTGFEERLAKMGLLDLLYELYTFNQMYQRLAEPLAIRSCQLISKNVKVTTDHFEELIRPYTDRAKTLADFYTSDDLKKPYEPKPWVSSSQDRLGLDSFLSDILDKERTSGIISECY